jgi:ABC-type uncharacterized transport system permease subunit
MALVGRGCVVGVPVPHPGRFCAAGRRAGACCCALCRLFVAQGLWIALLTSGARQGLAGALEVAGPIGQLTPYVPAGYGFAAIIVAFVGRLHPVGMVFSAILMSMFYIGGELAQSRLGLPKSLTGVFQGLLLFTLLACDTLIAYRLRWTGQAAAKGAH